MTHIPWKAIWKNTFISYTWPENNNILYILLHNATRTNDHIFRWTNQKHLKTPKCKLCKNTENIKHLFIDCKRNRKIWTHFQKYYQKVNTKRLYTTATHFIYISNIITTKHQETGSDTNHDDTHTYMENKKQTRIR